jgi:DNA-directed RNA polymerase subunit A'
LPRNLNIVFRSSLCQKCISCQKEQCSFDAYVSIRQGKLKSGTIEKTAIGVTEGQLISAIAHDYGNKRAIEFIEQCANLSIRFLMIEGLSLGLDDFDITKQEKREIENVLKDIESAKNFSINRHQLNRGNYDFDQSIENKLEMDIKIQYSNTFLMISDILIKPGNLNGKLKIMAILGSSKLSSELMQISYCVDTEIDKLDERISLAYNDRMLPHFKPNSDINAKYRYKNHSFREGLPPLDFFVEAIRGRREIINTNWKNTEALKLKRKIIDATYNLKVFHDGTVRTLSGKIVQFEYGEDGTDPKKSDFGECVDVARIVDSVMAADMSSEIGSGEISGNPQLKSA